MFHFLFQAIIANPVAYGHIHCAEKLNCQLHLFFLQPWTPTIAFPHPFSNLPYRIRDTTVHERRQIEAVGAGACLTAKSRKFTVSFGLLDDNFNPHNFRIHKMAVALRFSVTSASLLALV